MTRKVWKVLFLELVPTWVNDNDVYLTLLEQSLCDEIRESERLRYHHCYNQQQQSCSNWQRQESSYGVTDDWHSELKKRILALREHERLRCYQQSLAASAATGRRQAGGRGLPDYRMKKGVCPD